MNKETLVNKIEARFLLLSVPVTIDRGCYQTLLQELNALNLTYAIKYGHEYVPHRYDED